MDFIVKENYEMNFKEIAKDVLDISEKSFYDIKKGRVPRKQLFRKIAGYLKETYSVKLTQGDDMKISIRNLVYINGTHNIVRDTQSSYGINQNSKTINEYLLDKITELKNEIKKLKKNKPS